MVAISRGDIWWADISEPIGSAPGFRRPVIVIQGDPINRSRIATVVCVPLTSDLQWADAPGNVALSAGLTGLSKDSVANVSQIVTLDRRSLTERIGKIPVKKIELILSGIDVILGRYPS
jgi:mRNA interferase MazF